MNFAAPPEFVRLAIECIRRLEDELITIPAGDPHRTAADGSEQLVERDLLSAQVDGLHSSTSLPRMKWLLCSLTPTARAVTVASSLIS